MEADPSLVNGLPAQGTYWKARATCQNRKVYCLSEPTIGGAALLQHGVEYFNPDEAARRILAANPTIIQEDANSAAWHEGKRLLERAITERLNFAFETTL
ncbi:MAG: hypothetical protein ABSC64_21880, partial [Candidatus Korobacteraceae bacterium]